MCRFPQNSRLDSQSKPLFPHSRCVLSALLPLNHPSFTAALCLRMCTRACIQHSLTHTHTHAARILIWTFARVYSRFLSLSVSLSFLCHESLLQTVLPVCLSEAVRSPACLPPRLATRRSLFPRTWIPSESATAAAERHAISREALVTLASQERNKKASKQQQLPRVILHSTPG